MSVQLKYAIEASVFWPPADRVVSSGYKTPISEKDVYKLVKSVDGVDGVELYFPYDFTNIEETKKIVSDAGLLVSAVGAGIFSEPKWQHGSLCSCDEKTRCEALDICKKAIDAASELGAEVMVLWPAHDGYDYYFQIDYQKRWHILVESVREIALADASVKVGIEYKQKEPRTHQLVPNSAKALMLCEDVNLDNVGVIIDIGHSFIARENPAEEAAYLSKKNRLVHLHSNDNYSDWDYDMIPGSVHFWENLEFCYWINKIGYDGWINFDICPFREDAVRACNLSIKHTKKMVEFAQKLDDSIIEKVTASNDALAAQEYLWEMLFASS